MGEREESVRIDQWVWAARFFKTRSAASKAVNGGKVQLNGRRPKPASTVRVGDEVRIQKGPYEFHLVVQGLAERRGPASKARTLYEETADSRAARERMALQLRAMPDFEFREGGRPTKKQRRELERLRGFRKK